MRIADAIVGEIAAHVEDPDVIPLSAGYPSLDLIPREELLAATLAAVERRGARAFQYGPIEGVGELREALAALGRARGLDDDADSIVVTTGARQALTLVARAALRPGDKVACESPTFMGHHRGAACCRRRGLPGADRRPTASTPTRSSSCCAATRSACSRRSRGCRTRPAPTSPRQRRERLVALARQHGFFILEDAVYGDLRFEGEDPGPLRALAPCHVIYVDSLSKTVGPGLRAGWVAASGPVLDRIVAEKRRDDAHGATLTQLATAGFLAAGRYPAQVERAAARATASTATSLLDVLDAELAEPALASLRRPAAATSG